MNECRFTQAMRRAYRHFLAALAFMVFGAAVADKSAVFHALGAIGFAAHMAMILMCLEWERDR